MNSVDPKQVLGINDLAKDDKVMFAATGILEGPMLKGVITTGEATTTHSLVMRSKTKTVRFLETRHHPEKVANYLKKLKE
jgi:fructose-1,6-bisphosphatase II